jgi:hypothetical protein
MFMERALKIHSRRVRVYDPIAVFRLRGRSHFVAAKARPPPKVKLPSVMISIDDSDSQVPFSAPSFYPDQDYPMDSYVS